MDVTDSTAVAAFAAEAEARFGRIDICVTNSGGPPSNVFKNTKAGRLALRRRPASDEQHLFCKRNYAAHAEKQVGTSDYDYIACGHRRRGWSCEEPALALNGRHDPSS
jgi:NAD(P)-dependent dehydrogenase (short-subunit alcohol dehydrogenase family)